MKDSTANDRCDPGLFYCLFFLFLTVPACFFVVPAMNVLLLGKPVYALLPRECNLTAVTPNTPFPYATRDFYANMYGMTDLSLEKDWYYSDWLLFPGPQGLCPFNQPLTITCERVEKETGYCEALKGGTSIKYCWRPHGRGQPKEGQWVSGPDGIMQRLDAANALAGVTSDMAAGYETFRRLYFLIVGMAVSNAGLVWLPLLSAPLWWPAWTRRLGPWETRHGLPTLTAAAAFLLPLAVLYFFAYWICALHVWQGARDPAQNPAFTTETNWQAVFPHCAKVRLLTKETHNAADFGGGTFGSFRYMASFMVFFAPVMWLPGAVYALYRRGDIADAWRILVCGGAGQPQPQPQPGGGGEAAIVPSKPFRGERASPLAEDL